MSESIPYLSSLLTHDSVRIQAKALWLLGEMELVYPHSMQDEVPAIAFFLDSPEPLLGQALTLSKTTVPGYSLPWYDVSVTPQLSIS